jgi:hypothetical protein
MASVPMRVDVCRNHITKNKKLFVNATFLLALCARPYPLPLGLLVILAGGSCGRVAVGHVDNVDNLHQVAWPF